MLAFVHCFGTQMNARDFGVESSKFKFMLE